MDGKVSYSTNGKDWIEFATGNKHISKLAAGSSYVLGATDTGKLLVMTPEGDNVLGFESYNFSTDSEKVVEFTHIAAYEDTFALVVAEVEVENQENKEPAST